MSRPPFVFVSYTAPDRAWAEWIGWTLEEGGVDVVVQAWDYVPGSNFVVEMHSAAARADRTVIVLSDDYLRSAYCAAEWTAAFVGDPASSGRRLIPIRVRPCHPTGLLAAVVYVDLVGIDEANARVRVRDALAARRAKPESPPRYPGRDHDRPAVGAYPGTPASAASPDPLDAAFSWYALGGPTEVELAQTLGIEADADAIRARWAANESSPISTPIGVDHSGAVVSLRLAADGPFGTVLGTSGSGASEVMRTLVVSSALQVSPQRLRFHLLDFKGGFVWHSVRDLPHVETFLTLDEASSVQKLSALIDALLASKTTQIQEFGGPKLSGKVLGRQVPWDWFLVDEAYNDPLLQDSLVRAQQIGRSLGVGVTIATQRGIWMWERMLAFERYRIALHHYDADALPHEVAERLKAAIGSPLPRVPPGRGLLIYRGTEIVPFQSFISGQWRQEADSPFLTSERLEALVAAVRAAADVAS